jgi:hypothetical protein
VTRFAVAGIIVLVLAVQLFLPRSAAGSVSATVPVVNPRVTPTPTTTVVIGDANVEATVDGLVAGTAKAYPYSPPHGGTIHHLRVYLDATSQPVHFQVGLYADSGTGHPGTLLTSTIVCHPVAGQWNAVNVEQVSISFGHTYWIALLSGAPGMRIRDTVHGELAELSQETTLKTLPATRTTGTTFNRAPASLYGHL